MAKNHAIWYVVGYGETKYRKKAKAKKKPK